VAEKQKMSNDLLLNKISLFNSVVYLLFTHSDRFDKNVESAVFRGCCGLPSGHSFSQRLAR